MGCFSIVKNVQFQFFVCFNAEQTSMQTTISIGMLYDLQLYFFKQFILFNKILFNLNLIYEYYVIVVH